LTAEQQTISHLHDTIWPAPQGIVVRTTILELKRTREIVVIYSRKVLLFIQKKNPTS